MGLAALLALALGGCVERWLIVRTTPETATVWVDGREVALDASGQRRLPFSFYGTRIVEARCPGHRPLRVAVEVSPPWYQWPPFDLFAEVLWPWTIHDEHPVPLRLEPRPEPGPPEDLEARARLLAGADPGGAAPPAPAR